MPSKFYTFVSIIVVLGPLCPITATAEDLQNGTSKEVTRANDVTGFYQKAVQCKSNEDCKNGGECDARDDGKFCSCPEGTEGDFCDRVPSCDGVDCGNVAECKYSKDKKAGVCECKQSKLTFIHNGKKCKACRCDGGGYCEEEKGELVCKCHKGWGVVPPRSILENPYCKKCDCGGEYNCRYYLGSVLVPIAQKACLCPDGYEDKNGKCIEKCITKCGVAEDDRNGEVLCDLNNSWEAVCSCKDEKQVFKEDKTCEVDKCWDTCGVASDNKKGPVLCDGGPFGDVKCTCKEEKQTFHKETKKCQVDKCKAKCGVAKDDRSGEVLCDLNDYGEAVCSCKDPKKVLTADNTCEVCECEDGYCEEESGKQVCKCYNGWGFVPEILSSPYCKKCDCGDEYNCTYTVEDYTIITKTCLCPVGYRDYNGTCIDDKCQSMCGTKYGDNSGEVLCIEGPFGNVKCECHHYMKVFDEDDKKCKHTCYHHGDCLNGGRCKNGKICSCLAGTEGSFCEKVLECRFKNCGTDAKCVYDITTKSAICECMKNGMVFDESERKCKDGIEKSPLLVWALCLIIVLLILVNGCLVITRCRKDFR